MLEYLKEICSAVCRSLEKLGRSLSGEIWDGEFNETLYDWLYEDEPDPFDWEAEKVFEPKSEGVVIPLFTNDHRSHHNE